ncbi:MAG TPA: hypothetical protein VMS43_12815 [Allosphingosinicella sp.]|nr:hypothetical protein [Allosphingosinicella sp.]
MAGSSLFGNLARAAKLLALLLFLLPFVAVSCSPQALLEATRGPGAPAMPEASSLPGGGRNCTLITASGLQLAIGNATASRDCAELMGGGNMMPEGSASTNNGPFSNMDYFVIGAAALILLSLLATFLLGARGFLVAAGGCLVAALLLAYDIFMRIPNEVRAGPRGQGGGDGPSPEQLAQIVHIRPEIGFWLTLVALAAAIALSVMAAGKVKATVPPPAV